MAPNHGYIMTDASGEPVSRTYQYRKVMKPMLERKRRARINRCLDELKELMTGALQTEGENVAKLEKADILELTVRHLHNLRRQNQIGTRSEQTYVEKFKAGFRHCAAEVTHFLGQVDQNTSVHVLKHLNGCIKRLDVAAPMPQSPPPPPVLPPAVVPLAQPHIPHALPPKTRYIQQKPLQQWPQKINGNSNEFHAAHQLPPPPLPAAPVVPHINVINYNKIKQYDMEDDDMTRINTPPHSPNIDVDDLPVWRPW